MSEVIGSTGVGMPAAEWSSRAEMMRERKIAVAALEREAWLDWKRPLAGAMSLLLLLMGQFLATAVLFAVDTSVPGETMTAALLVAGCAALIAIGAILGIRTWRRGRRVVDALVAWEELTDRMAADGSVVEFSQREIQDAMTEDERRLIKQRNWIYFRARQFDVRQAPRLTIAALLLVPGLVGPFGLIQDIVARDVRWEVLAIFVPSLTALLFCGVVFGGVQRFANALFRRDRAMRRAA